MKIFLILFVLFFSSPLYSAEGDTYFCESTNLAQIINGSTNEFRNEKFYFLRKKNKIEFVAEGFFKDHYMPVTYSLGEHFKGHYESQEVFMYIEGIFSYSAFGVGGEIVSMSANCKIK